MDSVKMTQNINDDQCTSNSMHVKTVLKYDVKRCTRNIHKAMQCLHCFTHAFSIAQAALAFRVNVVLKDVLTNVRFVNGFS